ncbi:MAG: hypothetical protein WC675_04800 [Patescibacteria group bacterium]|jgi:phosphoribosylaminoimidazolecarboxamide formyltransferase/IMP cyclohydrolase
MSDKVSTADSGIVRAAFLSVADKTEGIAAFARYLHESLGLTLYGSDGTTCFLEGSGITCNNYATIGSPPMFDHGVVSLHPKVLGALCAKPAKPKHLDELRELGGPLCEIFVGGFYDLQAAIDSGALSFEEVLEKVDVGGPAQAAMGSKRLRIVVVDESDIPKVWEEMVKNDGDVLPETRKRLAGKALAMIARHYLTAADFISDGQFAGISGERVLSLAYGPNPHQVPAALYTGGGDWELAPSRFVGVEGMSPSCNNLDDLHTLTETMTRLAAVFPADTHSFALADKHVNICGAGIVKGKGRDAIVEAVRSMIEGDELAIHGGVLLFNFHITAEIADMLLYYHMPKGQRRILDAVFAPSADENAIEILARKKTGKCRVMLNPALAGNLPMDNTPIFTHVGGGDYTHYPPSQFVPSFDDPDLQIIGPRRPELEGCLKAGWAIGSQAKSNTITIVRQRQVRDMIVYELEGNGCGRMDRVGAAELAVRGYERGEANRQDEEKVGLVEAAAYSDSFLPFGDAGLVLHEAGITVLFASSGSVNDGKVQEELTAAGMTLYLMPDKKCRGFRH